MNAPPVKWLLEKDTFDEGLEPLQKAIRENGMTFKVTAHTSFEEDTYKGLFDEDDCVVTYGSLNLCRVIRRTARWVPGVWLDTKRYECTSYYPPLGEFLLNSPYIMIPFGELTRRRGFLFHTLGNNGCLFVRPNDGQKSFAGQIVTSETFVTDVSQMAFYDVEPNLLCIVAEPRNIGREWRCVVVGSKVVAASQYKNAGRLALHAGCPDDVRSYAQRVADAGWQPDRCWTVDICEVSNGSLRLMEIGSFCGAGLYRCDPNDYVPAVAAAAQEEWLDCR